MRLGRRPAGVDEIRSGINKLTERETGSEKAFLVTSTKGASEKKYDRRLWRKIRGDVEYDKNAEKAEMGEEFREGTTENGT